VDSGCIIGVAADLDSSTLSFAVDGQWHDAPFGLAFSNVAPRAGLVPVVTLGHGSDLTLE
jgi:hypothetical protein